MREEHGREQSAQHAPTRLLDLRIVGWSLDAPIRRIVLPLAVAIPFAVGLIVAICVAHNVGERKAVMRGGIVDRSPGSARAAIEQIARAGKACGEFAAHPVVTAPMSPDPIAETVVPFGKARRVVAELIAARSDVPGLGDQFRAREYRFLA